MPVTELHNLQGLSPGDVARMQQIHGRNTFGALPGHRLLKVSGTIIREPMFILLAVACLLYFIIGSAGEGAMMAIAITIISAISFYREMRSERALKALKQLTDPQAKVIREGRKILIPNEELVPGDILVLEEGARIPADAAILQANDLSVDESVLSGESVPVDKDETEGHNVLYQGAMINRGKCLARVLATGHNTFLGKIGKAIETYSPPKTLLQLQVGRFVSKLALFGLAGFLIIFLVNYLHHVAFATSLLFALTLAMSAIPEEIPVAFSSFMALGAYKMSRLGIISRQPQIIENLGAVSVLCLDKTGTITENTMQVKSVYDFTTDTIIEPDEKSPVPNGKVLWYAMLASEQHPFDTMEKAIYEAYHRYAEGNGYESVTMTNEYPLEGHPPMMTHVYTTASGTILAATKGAAERVMMACRLDASSREKITRRIQQFASAGYRILGTASAQHTGKALPGRQDDFDWQFAGLLALYDPPKKNIPQVLKQLYTAQIDVKLVTGDYPETAISIGQQAGILHSRQYLTGDALMMMPEDKVQTAAKTIAVFARMSPEAKLKLINAIKANGDIVAMTGDGVNDAPALKAAHIGIAMGRKGTETARQAADLILTDDNLEKIVIAVREGRKIYSNLVKAIRYIISIHIPIILTASLPVLLGWAYPVIFSPVHIIFLELIMGPTCSVFFEKEPVEEAGMLVAPRRRDTGLFTREELLISIVQGLLIAAAVLALYFVFMNQHYSIEETRTAVFSALILSNVFLTFTSRSYSRTLYHTIRYRNPLTPVILLAPALFLFLLHFVHPVQQLFRLAPVDAFAFWLCFAVSFAGVMWFEVFKTGLNTSDYGR